MFKFNVFKKKPQTLGEIARQNEANYRRWLAEHPFTDGQQHELELMYTDKVGNNFYVSKNPLKTTFERQAAIEEKVAAIDYNLTKPELKALVSDARAGIRAAVETGDGDTLAASLSALDEIDLRAERLAATETLLDLACVIFLIDGENPETFNEFTFERKRVLAKADDDLRLFFCQMCWDAYKVQTAQLNFNLPAYLTAMKKG